MNILNTFKEAKTYFEVLATYNVDRFRFQSMLSTAHKLETLNIALRSGMSFEDISKGISSVSNYWFYKVLHSPLFSAQRDGFEQVRKWADTHGVSFNIEPESFNTDTYCHYMLIKNPHSGGYEIFNLETASVFATTTLPAHNTSVAGITEVKGSTVPVYNFTRRVCGTKSLSVIGHQAAH